MLWSLLFFIFSFAFAQDEPNPEWFKCESFSQCEKVTGNVCDQAAAVNSKYVNEFIDYSNKQREGQNCAPITKKQIQDDLKKLATCRKGNCALIIPKPPSKKPIKKAPPPSKDIQINFETIEEEVPAE